MRSATPSSSASSSAFAASASPSGPLGPPTTTSCACWPTQLGQRADGDVETLERLDAADEQQHRRSVEPVPERRAGPEAVAGREEGVDHAGRDDLDAVGRRAVERHELLRLGRARRGDRVGAIHDLGLGLDPALGLGVAGLGLHPGQRVERRHQRNVELVLEPVAGHARQPVVGVDGVDVVRAPQVGEHAVGELVDDFGQLLLGQVGRTGVDVDDPEAGLDVDDVGQVVAPAAHVHRAGDAGLGQRRHELAHVDVHAPAVARAGLGQRGRVQREDGQRAHDGSKATGRRSVPRRPDPALFSCWNDS